MFYFLLLIIVIIFIIQIKTIVIHQNNVVNCPIDMCVTFAQGSVCAKTDLRIV